VLVDGAMTHYPWPDEGSWAADVAALCHDLVRLFRNPTTIAYVRTRAVADDPELTNGLRDLAAAEMAGLVREPFERAVARGELDATLSVETLAELVISPFLARVAVMRMPVDENLGKSVAAVMRAIGPPGTNYGGTGRDSTGRDSGPALTSLRPGLLAGLYIRYIHWVENAAAGRPGLGRREVWSDGDRVRDVEV
jgi:Tetracyclin repressor-like, C-terminal domain